MTNKKQWQKRVDLTQYAYSCLIQESSKQEIIDRANMYDFDANQLKVIEYLANHKDDMVAAFSNNLSANWTWERLPYVEQAILLIAYCEVKANNLAKAIAIDQALVTAKRYGQEQTTKFINAILDKIL